MRIQLTRFAVAVMLSGSAVLAQAPAGTAPAAAPAGAAQPTTEERLAAIKQSLAQSQKNLRSYEWVETTVIAMKGEVKSQTQARCYYGADGTLQKTPISAPPPPAKEQKGLRGKVVASKKEEISDYMKKAVALVKSYVPPDPALIQKSKDAGKMSTEMVQPGKLLRLVFRDYRLPGDSLGLGVDLTSNKLTGINVASYIDKPSDAVTLDVTMGVLDDGSVYSAKTVLNATAQNMIVTITNSGYKKNG